MKDIEEMIADAKAEEEVAKEQAKTREEDNFRERLREQLKEAFTSKEDSKVSISLKEYVLLRQKETDLDRILNAIVDSLELGYNKDSLVIRGQDKVVGAFKALYPEVYDALLVAELEHAEHEGN